MKKISVICFCFFLFVSLFSLAEAQPKKDWSFKGVTIGAAPVGGVYYVWAGGPAKILGEILGIPASIESTGGPVHNTQLVDAKELHFGMVTAAPVYEGWHGLGWAKGKKHQNVRAIFPMYTSYFHMYALKKVGITKVRDIADRVVGTGPVGGTPATYWPLLFEVNGIKPKRIVNASFSDLDNQLKDGLLDVIGHVVGIPVGTILSAETTHDINLFGVEDEAAHTFIQKYPYFSKGIIPKGTYKSAPHDISTVCLWNFFITYKDMPDDLVYEFTKQIFLNKELLVKVHKSAQEIEMKKILLSPIPLHPGAIKYYEENGVKIPKELRS